MPDFSHLYQRPAGKTPKPKALPQETYPGIVKSFSFEETAAQKIPCVRFQVGLLGWPTAIPESDRVQEDADGHEVPIDLTKRQFRRDMMTPPDFSDRAWYYFDELLRSCGIEPDGRSYEELIPQMIGQRVSVEIQQYLNQNTNEIGNQVGKIYGDKLS